MKTPLERLPQIINAAKALLKTKMINMEISEIFEGLRAIPADRFDASMVEAYPIVDKLSSGFQIGCELKRIAGESLSELSPFPQTSRRWGLRQMRA